MYNVACTLRAFRLVQDRHPDATLTVVGDGTERRTLERLAVDLRLRGVTFTGRLSPDRIPEVYAASDIYVQTPDIDNMPSSVIEAFATGTPVVATSVGGVPAILQNGVHGLLAPADDAPGVAAQILRLLADTPLATRLAVAARASCGRLQWPAVRPQWLALYRELLDAPAPAAAEVRHA